MKKISLLFLIILGVANFLCAQYQEKEKLIINKLQCVIDKHKNQKEQKKAYASYYSVMGEEPGGKFLEFFSSDGDYSFSLFMNDNTAWNVCDGTDGMWFTVDKGGNVKKILFFSNQMDNDGIFFSEDERSDEEDRDYWLKLLKRHPQH